MADPSIVIGFEPDWTYRPEVSYSFQTVVQSAPSFIEQRRPLLPTPVRSVKCKIVLENSDQVRFINTLTAGKGAPVCSPIYSEPMFANTISQGGSSITITTDLTNLWNIKNCSYAILLDYISGQSEMVKVASVVGQLVSLVAPITKSWNASRTVIYPGMAAMIKGIKPGFVTDRIGATDIQFDEISEPTAAVKAWEGSDLGIICFDIGPDRAYYTDESDWTYGQRLRWKYNPANPVTSNKYTQLTSIPDWPYQTWPLVISHPFTSAWTGRHDLVVSDYNTATFWLLTGVNGPVQTSWIAPGVQSAGVASYLTGWGISPVTGKLFVCTSGSNGASFMYRRNLRYTSPGGALEYDSGVLGPVSAYGHSAGTNYLFQGNLIYELYNTAGYGLSYSAGFCRIDESFSPILSMGRFFRLFYGAGTSDYATVWVQDYPWSCDTGAVYTICNSALGSFGSGTRLIAIDFSKVTDLGSDTFAVPLSAWLTIKLPYSDAFPRGWANISIRGLV